MQRVEDPSRYGTSGKRAGATDIACSNGSVHAAMDVLARSAKKPPWRTVFQESVIPRSRAELPVARLGVSFWGHSGFGEQPLLTQEAL